MQFNAPRGTNDFLPETTASLQRIEAAFRKLCELYGYQEVRTPTFEHAELFTRGIGETTDIVTKEMYVFKDKGGRELALRPEATASVARAYVEHKLYRQRGLCKFYYSGSIFRYERPQAGRYRESTQLGVEAIGSADPWLDVEVIDLNLALLREAGISGTFLEINSVGCPECRPSYREALIAYCKAKIEGLCADCRTRYAVNPLRVLDCKQEQCRETISKAPEIGDFLCEECSCHFKQVRDGLETLGHTYRLRPHLVRGLDYYTKTAFEICSERLGAQNQVSGGGRYDGLIEECGGPPTPAVGFAAGLQRMALLLEKSAEAQLAPLVFVAHLGEGQRSAALEMTSQLRHNEISADMDFSNRSLRAQLRQANRLGCRFAVIIGEEEVKSGLYAVKDLDSGRQSSVSKEKVVEHLKAGRVAQKA